MNTRLKMIFKEGHKKISAHVEIGVSIVVNAHIGTMYKTDIFNY